MASTKYKTKFIRKIYREKDIENIQKKLNMLPCLKNKDAVNYMNIRIFITIIIFFVFLLVFKLGYLMAPIVSVIFYISFDYINFDRKLKKRGLKLEKEALQFFETLTLTLESGRNLEHALDVTCLNINSELSHEFSKTLIEMKFGKTLIESLESMKLRIPSETINNIILNITQTNVFGNSILETMYNQIDYLRDKQLFKMKEEINKIPNKVSILSVLFIVPLILILILGPFLINFLK